MSSRFTSKLTSIRFEDANGTGLTVGPGPGDFTISNLFVEDNFEALEARNRGVHDGLIEGDDLTQEVSGTIEVVNQTLTDSSNARVTDFIRRKGIYDPSGGSTPLTSVDDTIWAWKTIFTFSDGVTTATITLPKCRGMADFSESREGHTMSVQMTNYTAPVLG